MSYKEYTVRVWYNGNKNWYLNGELHREDGPACEWADAKYWYLNGKRHREDGPAVENSHGSKSWWINDQRHREDGPAVEWSDGIKQWFLNDVEYTEEEFKKKISPAKEYTVAELEKLLGHPIKVVS